jgi:hypothetical protein
MRRILCIASVTCMAGLASARSAYAQSYPNWLKDVDFDDLVTAYPGSLATGSNVPVTIVESYGSRSTPNDPTTAAVNDSISYSFYNLDTTQGFFAGKTIVHKGPALQTLYFRDGVTPFQVLSPSVLSVSTSQSSAHANTVGAYFFGTPPGGFTQRSVAPGINNIEVFDYQWNNSYFLDPGSPAPNISTNQSRVATHAYGQGNSLENVQRMDWLIETDDFVQVVGTPAVSGHGNAFNTIAVAHTTAGTTAATQTLSGATGTPYVAGRAKPDVTGPIGTVSDNTGAVGGLAALLISRGKANASLSNHSYTARPGYTVRSAETSEVVKAAIMAGALRSISGTDGRWITTYRANVANQTVNGLDNRYGAGMMNAYNSYKIVDAGEYNSFEDGASAGRQSTAGTIAQFGFDYDPSFGGAGGTNAVATYTFQATAAGEFDATLAWNVDVLGPTGQFNNFDGTATLFNLDLTLTDLTTNAVVASSLSTIDNTENLWTTLVAGHSYAMTATAVGTPFNWDYGLAWRSTVPLTTAAVPEPGVVGLIMTSAVPLVLARRRRRV